MKKINRNQNIAIVGVPGSGKTTVVNKLLKNTSKNVFDSFISVSDEELLLKQTGVKINLNKDVKKADNLKNFNLFIEIAKSATSKNKNICFIIDEFENLVNYFGSIEKAENYLNLFKDLNVTFIITSRGCLPDKECVKISRLYNLSNTSQKTLYQKLNSLSFAMTFLYFISFVVMEFLTSNIYNVFIYIASYLFIISFIFLIIDTSILLYNHSKNLYNTRRFKELLPIFCYTSIFILCMGLIYIISLLIAN